MQAADTRGVGDDVRSGAVRHARGLAAVIVTVALSGVLVELVQHGSAVDEWDLGANLGLAGGALLATVALWQRWYVDRRAHMFLVALAMSCWAAGQLTWIVLHNGWGVDLWPGPADVSFALVPVFGLAATLVRLRRFPPIRRLAIVVDAVVMALAANFVTWELWIRDAVEGYTGFEQTVLVGLPMAEVFVVALSLVMLLQQRSLTLGYAVFGWTCLAVADTMYAASGGFLESHAFVVAYGWWTGTFVALAALSGRSSRFVTEDNRRPEMVRMVAVYLPATVSMLLATQRYLLDRHPISTMSGVLAVVFVVSVTADQLVRAWESSDYSQRLSRSVNDLAATERKLRSLLDDLPSAVLMIDAHGVVREANAVAQTLTGRSSNELIGQHFSLAVREDHREVVNEAWRELQLGNGEGMQRPTLPLAPPADPHMLVELDALVPLRDRENVVVTLRDVTANVREATALERARERFRLAFHGAPTGMSLSSVHDGQILDANESLLDMLGIERRELLGRRLQDITHPDDWQRTSIMLTRAAAGAIESFALEQRYLRPDGSMMWAQTSVSVLDLEHEAVAIAHVQDITEQRRAAEQLRWAATHDELTRLPNRSHFTAELTELLASSPLGTIAVMFIDLDNFKVINDSLGHATGDQLLKGMTQRLRAVLRDHDMLSRFGGDEFIVILNHFSADGSPAAMAERLRAEIARPLTVDGVELFVTGSIGIAVADRADVTASDLLRDADAAMYRAKARGRDCVEIFAKGVHDASVIALRTTNELRRGIERDEIVPYYQPIVDLHSGVLTGFEVLARWRHPDRGLLVPDQFLPMAEETGLIADVGAAILRASLVQLGLWRERVESFADLSIAVNVSSRQLLGGAFAEVVADSLGEAGVPAGLLWLEITETALMTDVKAASIALRELRSIGLHLSVDDFGTGYSSLTYLKRFPVEAIKIDRTFVNGLGIDNEDSTIVEAVINLGHSLGLAVVAEGVETPLQLSRLRELRCDRGQGYLFGRPRPAEIIEAERSLLAAERPMAG
ncbi:MAG: putative bifunctional diguanylate cyclase/phosphodiesterase [Ilumatobacteraceae bacterium]